jgi:isochorismate synthase
VTRPASASAAGFREALERVVHEVEVSPPGGLHLATCHLPPDVDPLLLWGAAPPDVFASFWEAEGESVAGIGVTPDASVKLDELEEDADSRQTGALRRFGGVPFAPDWTDEDWRPLTEAGFVLPRWTLHRPATGESVKVTLSLRGTAATISAQELDDEFRRILEVLAGEAGIGSGADTRRAAAAAPLQDGRNDGARAAWEAAVGEALSSIEAGDLAKVVLARRVAEPRPPHVDAAKILRRLRAEGSGRFRFGLRRGGRAFVGASPECLLRKRGREVEVEALAGTYDLGTEQSLVDAAEHLFASGKDLEEHALVVRGVMEALEPLAVSVAPDEWPRVREARRLAHLSTTVRARVAASVRPYELIRAIHPTPAVGGLPREAALRLIRRVEPSPRGLFAAPVGWISADGDACLAVGIRSALLLESHAWVYAGAGIVGASDAAAEWDETAAKLRWFRELVETEESE